MTLAATGRDLTQNFVATPTIWRNIMFKKIRNFIKEEEGLTTVEYAVAGALVSAAVITAFTLLGTQVDTVIRTVCNAFTPTTGTAC
jgi:pilus assembly protein Flp/PilA